MNPQAGAMIPVNDDDRICQQPGHTHSPSILPPRNSERLSGASYALTLGAQLKLGGYTARSQWS